MTWINEPGIWPATCGARAVTLARLELLGYLVVEADNGPAAIERSGTDGPGVAIVVSDVVMPGGMSGDDVARWVGRHAPAVKVLLTSGYISEVASARQGEADRVRLMRKPYSRAELARALRGVLDR